MVKRKILFFIDSLDIGGAEKSLITFLQTIDFDNAEVDLLMLAKGAFLESVPLNINISLLKQLQPSLSERVSFFLKKKFNFEKKHNSQYFWQIFESHYATLERKYDIAIAYGQGFPTYFVGDKVFAKKKIAWVNTDYKKAGYNSNIDFQFYNKFDEIIAVSEAGAQSFMDAFDKKIGGNIKIIEDLIDYKNILSKAKEPVLISKENCLKIVTVGRLDPSKGYHFAISAAVILKKKGMIFKWWFVGEGRERVKLERLIAINNLKDCVILVGLDLNPYKYMRAADIYVQTSVYEGFSITIREAQVLEKLIISTDFPSIKSAIINEENGLICEKSAESIARQIIRLEEDYILKNKILTNVSNKFSRDEDKKILKLKNLMK